MQIIAHQKYASRSPNTDFPLPKFEKNVKNNIRGFNFFRHSDIEDTGKTVYISHILAAQDLGVENPNKANDAAKLIIDENVFVLAWLCVGLLLICSESKRADFTFPMA